MVVTLDIGTNIALCVQKTSGGTPRGLGPIVYRRLASFCWLAAITTCMPWVVVAWSGGSQLIVIDALGMFARPLMNQMVRRWNVTYSRIQQVSFPYLRSMIEDPGHAGLPLSKKGAACDAVRCIHGALLLVLDGSCGTLRRSPSACSSWPPHRATELVALL